MSPFQSKAQRAYLYANKPKLAEQWSRYKTLKSLPIYKNKTDYKSSYQKAINRRLKNK